MVIKLSRGLPLTEQSLNNIAPELNLGQQICHFMHFFIL